MWKTGAAKQLQWRFNIAEQLVPVRVKGGDASTQASGYFMLRIEPMAASWRDLLAFDSV